MNKNRRLALVALLSVLAIAIGLFERQFFFFLMVIPGAKLGLANVITLIALHWLPPKDVLHIIVTRLLLTAFLSGTLSTLLYSSAGALLSFVVMYACYKRLNRYLSILGISLVGGFMHSLGQLFVAAFIAQTWLVFLYLPVFALSGMTFGLLVGFVGKHILDKAEKLQLFTGDDC